MIRATALALAVSVMLAACVPDDYVEPPAGEVVKVCTDGSKVMFWPSNGRYSLQSRGGYHQGYIREGVNTADVCR